ncbi:MAG: hypothetical protein EBU49_06660, partial [Proteobacteria bacterium]|nr:hypothetical protein [Pseudomonadota bacterium]
MFEIIVFFNEGPAPLIFFLQCYRDVPMPPVGFPNWSKIVASTSAQSQQHNPWPMHLSGTGHVRPCIVVSRDPQASTFAVRAVAGGPATDLTKSEAFLFEQIRASGVQVVLQSKFGSASGTQNI